MTATELLERVRDTRAGWDELLAGVGDEAWDVPGVAGAWTLRDVVAHVSWFEREMVEVLRTRRFEGSDLWLLPCDERNAAIHRRNAGRALSDVRAESALLRDELSAQLATLRDDDLDDPGRFPPMPPDWRPAEILAQNTFEHYTAHALGLRRWLAERRKETDR